ncbi:MAG TPA: hypothetical protein VH934_05745 [Xanthobacteraceae bacterium]|jgi:hypothetical protein
MKGEPPSASSPNSSLFLIGKNSRGHWVVQDQKGLCGGLFVDRAEALKFAMFENGHRPQAVIMVPGILELDMSRKPNAGDRTSSSDISTPVARAA